MRVFYFVLSMLVYNSLFAQQMIVKGSYSTPIFTYQFDLVEKTFIGKVRVIAKFSTKNNSCKKMVVIDTIIYISNEKGLFNFYDTSKQNLNDMFEGIHFDYNPLSKNITDKFGKRIEIFDTSYKYKQDNFEETTMFYPIDNYFILKQNKNFDTTCRYMERLFDKDRNIKKITYYHNKQKCISNDSLLNYLSKERFSEMYEFTYTKSSKKIATINYYRTDKKSGKKFLYASNKYTYNRNDLLLMDFFEQFNGKTKVKGKIFFNYFPTKESE